MRYKTRTLEDILTLTWNPKYDFVKSYFPSNYEYWFVLISRELTKVEWNEVMAKLAWGDRGDDMVEDMMKVFQKHFKKTYKELKESSNELSK